jgi:hypothetical protein
MKSATNPSSLPKGALATLAKREVPFVDDPGATALLRQVAEDRKRQAGFYLVLIQHCERQRRIARRWSRFALSI